MSVARKLDPEKTLDWLLAGEARGRVPAIPVAGLALDTRRIRPGWLFLACRGSREHGLHYLAEAVAHGATAVAYEPDKSEPLPTVGRRVAMIPVPDLRAKAGVLAARFFDDPSARLAVTGVTGTNGKGSVCMILGQVLSDWGEATGVIGSLGYGLYGMLNSAIETTPGPVRLQYYLARLAQQGAGHAAVEVSSHALDQNRVGGMHFENAVFTNLTRDHLDYHGTMESYRDAKAKLFAWPGLRRAILNLDDPVSEYLYAKCARNVERIGYGLSADAPAWFKGRRLYAREVHVNGAGLEVEVAGDFGAGRMRSRMIGRFNVSNLLAALTVLVARGHPFAEALSRVAHARTVAGRMERFGGGHQPLVIVDYAHTTDALGQVLAAVREHTRGRLILVFGCGGERRAAVRSEMGRIAAAGADRIVLTDDNPRGEDGDRIIADIRSGMPASTDVVVERDRARALEIAIGEAGPGDVVLATGKGHETEQIVDGEHRRYSDRATARQLLEAPRW
ncbi:MAG: UDP-N-acetylmuramoyl-L-alanyl-D-glutamate--2,6-diaminopimelate ligase [Gammaproteobacteria bacterium]